MMLPSPPQRAHAALRRRGRLNMQRVQFARASSEHRVSRHALCFRARQMAPQRSGSAL